VPEALRDFVLLPSADGTDATLVVVDRANTTAAKRAMHLRFRVPAPIEIAGDAGTATIGGTQLAIATIAKTGGSPQRGSPSGKDCFAEGIDKGKCDAARFSVTDYRLIVPGPKPRAVHAISATSATKPRITSIGEKTWAGVRITGVREAVVVWPLEPASAFTYRAPKGTHVVLDAPDKVAITATTDGDDCSVSVKSGGDVGAPAIITVDEACKVAIDPEAANAASALGTKPPPIRKQATARRSGCCGAQTTPGSTFAIAIVVGWLLVRRRNR
jgi:hypothetical protein